MYKILIVCDVPNWAFDHNAQSIKKYCPEYDISITYIDRPDLGVACFDDYDVVLNQGDSMAHIFNKIDPKKHIFAVRSNLYISHYSNINMAKRVSILAVANQSMIAPFTPYYNKIYVAPGGVDNEIFITKPTDCHCPLIVGWSGTNYNPELRGTRLIKEACDKLGFIYKPAYREDKWRTTEEMVSYYQNEIDVYVDASFSAGRQNGLVEAASCGKPILATNVGVVKQLIKHKENGIIIDRSVDSICASLLEVERDYEKYSVNIKKEIDLNWSWKSQIKIYKQMFEEILCR